MKLSLFFYQKIHHLHPTLELEDHLKLYVQSQLITKDVIKWSVGSKKVINWDDKGIMRDYVRGCF